MSWRPPARADEVVRCYWKEGVNVGVSGMLRHYPIEDITFAVLAVGENAPWNRSFQRERSKTSVKLLAFKHPLEDGQVGGHCIRVALEIRVARPWLTT
jgi:hypothetical protein